MRSATSADCVGEPPGVPQDPGEVDVRHQVVALQGEGLAIGGDGLVRPAQLLQGDAEVDVRRSVILLDPDHLPVSGDGLVPLVQ